MKRENAYSHAVSGVLTENVQLTFKVRGIESAAARGDPIPIVGSEDNERLEDGRLLTGGRRTQNGPIRRHFSPAQHAQAQITCDLGEDCLLLLQADRIVRSEEDIPHSVLASIRQLRADVSLGLSLEEEVGNACHNTRTIAVTTVCTSSSTVGHGTEKLPGIRDDLVALLALNLTDEADTAGILLVLVFVEALTSGQGPIPGGGVTFHGVETILRVVKRRLIQ